MNKTPYYMIFIFYEFLTYISLSTTGDHNLVESFISDKSLNWKFCCIVFKSISEEMIENLDKTLILC